MLTKNINFSYVHYRHYCFDLFQAICANPQLFVDGANRMDVMQGRLGIFGAIFVHFVILVLFWVCLAEFRNSPSENSSTDFSPEISSLEFSP